MNALGVYCKEGPLFEFCRLFEPSLMSSMLISQKMSKLFHDRQLGLQLNKLIKHWKTLTS